MPFQSAHFNVSTADGRTCVLLEPVIYTTEAGEVIVIPKGATSDGASVPRGGWNLIPPFGDYWRAAFLHDHLYRATDKTKEQCDYLLLEAMQSLDVFRIERDVIYQGVVKFGQSSFQMDRTIKQ